MIDFVKRNCKFEHKAYKELVTSTSQNLLQSFFRIMNCFLCRYIDNEILKITIEDIAEL